MLVAGSALSRAGILSVIVFSAFAIAARKPAQPGAEFCGDGFCLDGLAVYQEFTIPFVIVSIRSTGDTLTDPVLRFTEISKDGTEMGEKEEQMTGDVKPHVRSSFTVRIDANCAGVSKIRLKATSPRGQIDQTFSFAPLFYRKQDAKRYAKQHPLQ